MAADSVIFEQYIRDLIDRRGFRGEPIKVVSERLGHASPTVTLSVYAHVLPGDQRGAATRFAALIGGAEA